jgi:RNA polymerase Rpb8
MDLTLDYNVELFPLQKDQSFALALASSLVKGVSGVAGGGAADGAADDADDKDRDVWRPDGKGRRGLEEDYDYVMYGRVSSSCSPSVCHLSWLNFKSLTHLQVYKFDGGTTEIVYVDRTPLSSPHYAHLEQDGVRFFRRLAHVFDWFTSAYD